MEADGILFLEGPSHWFLPGTWRCGVAHDPSPRPGADGNRLEGGSLREHLVLVHLFSRASTQTRGGQQGPVLKKAAQSRPFQGGRQPGPTPAGPVHPSRVRPLRILLALGCCEVFPNLSKPIFTCLSGKVVLKDLVGRDYKQKARLTYFTSWGPCHLLSRHKS